jgi:Kef-type K+ transport system membrane component KefB
VRFLQDKPLFRQFAIAAITLVAVPAVLGFQEGAHDELIRSVGFAILAATVMAFLGHFTKQPLLLAYIAAGIAIGPRIGLGLVASEADIGIISEFGLILMLFLIGLEIDIKELRNAGRSLTAAGFSQFLICVLLGLGFFHLIGYSMGGGNYDLAYLAVCCAISSTTIVVKLIYAKFELDTRAGRLTVGILVFQDIWAIILLGIQPNLASPEFLGVLLSFAKGGVLVGLSLLASKYVLPRLFESVAKMPELVLVASIGWCTLVCIGAAYLGLSLEMGALIAGVSISTFPYRLDVIAKVLNIRDFFITLFFVSLGMQIPNPAESPAILTAAAVASVFLIATRFISVFPVLYVLNNGMRVSLLTSINLSQMSEFSLVIAAIGAANGHIGQDILMIIIFVFGITSVLSTYTIKYSEPLQKALGGILKKAGFKETLLHEKNKPGSKEIFLLGFHRTASSLIGQIAELEENGQDSLKERLTVIDFNPAAHPHLKNLGIDVIYGDVSHPDTLQHSGIGDAKLVISTIPDRILVGTNNLKLLRHVKALSPQAKIIMTAENADAALAMYAEGADYVLLPRRLAADKLYELIGSILNDDPALRELVGSEIDALRSRTEVIR